MSGEATYKPWDDSPPTEAQHDYIVNLAKRIADHDWTTVADTTVASGVIDRLNSVCRSGKLAYEPF